MKIINKVIYIISLIIYRFRSFFFNLKPNIQVGKKVIIEPRVIIRSQYGGKIYIGDNCRISAGVQLLTHGGNITIGKNSTINPYTVIYGQGGTTIGNYVRIAAHCTIVPSNHIFKDISTPIYEQGLSKKGIFIEDDVWLGSGVRVLDGVTIKKGCVIGAGSVLTKTTEPFSIYVGVPGIKIKQRYK